MDNIKLKQLGVILILAGLVLAGLTLNARRVDGTLLAERHTADGRVIDRFTTGARGAADPELHVRVEFAAAGSTRVIDRRVDDDFWSAHAKGSSVRVAWFADKIEKARIVGATNEELLFWVKVGGGGLAILIGMIVLGYDRRRR